VKTCNIAVQLYTPKIVKATVITTNC
jgi:hypothetical protein